MPLMAQYSEARDYKQMVFAPITDEMAINVIARMLGLPKSY